MEKLSRPLRTLLAFAAITYSVGMGVDYFRIEADRRELTAAMEVVRPRAKLLPLIFDQRGSVTNTYPLMHAWGYYTLEKDISAPLLFASSRSYAFQFREAPAPLYTAAPCAKDARMRTTAALLVIGLVTAACSASDPALDASAALDGGTSQEAGQADATGGGPEDGSPPQDAAKADTSSTDGGKPLAADVNFTPNAVATTASKIVIRGSIGGEQIAFEWDYKATGQGAATNGAMFAQVGATSHGGVNLSFDNDYTPTYVQGPSDWYVRFTLGNALATDTVFNAKKTFAEPATPYSMITVRKGPSGTPYQHTEKDPANKTAAIVTQFTVDVTARTIRLVGGIRSQWGSDYLQADFNVLVGGPDDRNKNGGSIAYVFK
jgi:hypothetical protein